MQQTPLSLGEPSDALRAFIAGGAAELGVSRMTDEEGRTEIPLTTRVRVALSIARALAAAMGHDDVTEAHVLVGILREGENPAVAVLLHAGISLDALRGVLELLLEPRGRPRPREVARPLTEGERRLVERAEVECRQLHHQHLGTEHFLLAVLHEAASPVAQLLSRYALNYDALPAHMAAVIRYHPYPLASGTAAPPAN